jgi:hypothetical protein
MDSWYKTKDLMLFVESLGKFYYYPLQENHKGGYFAGQSAIGTFIALIRMQNNSSIVSESQ